MGVDTKAIIRKGTTIIDIQKALSEKYEDVKVHSNQPTFMQVVFNDGTEQRMMFVSFSNSCERENGIGGVWCSLGYHGKSVEILRYLCENFGGYLDENDCDDEGFYPINFHLYEKGEEFTPLDSFRHKVITKLGYDNLNAAMLLFEEYKSL